MPTQPRPEDLVTRLDDRLRGERKVDLGLAAVAKNLETLEPMAGLRDAGRLLVQKAADLQAAIADVSTTIQQLRDLEGTIRFTEIGWPGRRDEIASMCSQDPEFGLAAWLEDWYTALAAFRLDACDRLLSMESSLPPGAGVLTRHCRATTAALEASNLDVAGPLVEAGAAGIEVAGQTVPAQAVRADLWVLLIRFALGVERPVDGRRALDAAKETTSGPIFNALTERLRLFEPGAEPASADAMRIGAGSTDALLEMARVLNASAGSGAALSTDLNVDVGMTAARTAIGAARSLAEAEQCVVRMLAPVPAEIQLALAVRARAEDDVELARSALRAAADAAINEAVRAEAHDQLADLAVIDLDPVAERTERFAAVSAWSQAARPDRTLAAGERLIALDPEHAEARCFVASSLLQLAWTAPQENARRWLERAFEVIGPVQTIVLSKADELNDPNWFRAWAYNLESYANSRMGDLLDLPASDHLWRAFLLALRAVALQPDSGSGWWQCLADASAELKLWAVAEFSARVAARLEPSRDTVVQHARALSNLGEFEAALEVLGNPATDYEWNMRGHMLLCLGLVAQSVAVYREHPAETLSPWARLSAAQGLLLTGHAADAVAMMRDMDAWFRARPSQSAREAMARISMVIGDDKRVETLARDSRAGEQHGCDFALAIVRARQGRSDEASSLLRSYVGTFTTLGDVKTWHSIDLEVMRIVLGDGAVLPGLAEVNVELEALASRLVIRRDPIAEFGIAKDAAAGGEESAAAADQLFPIIVAVAQDDVSRVQDGLPAMNATDEIVTASLENWVGRRRQAQEAEAAVAAATADRSGEASRLIKELLEVQPLGVAALLESASPGGVAPEVLSAVLALTQDPDVGTSAELVAGQLGPPSATLPAQSEPALQFKLSIVLPASWFEGVANPTTEHPIFLRHMPSLRYLAATPVPPVNFASSEELEPNGYRILVLGRVVEEGSLPLGRRMITDEALALLPADVSETARPEDQPALQEFGHWTIPDGGDRRTLDELLSSSVLEVATRRLESIAASHASEIAEDAVGAR